MKNTLLQEGHVFDLPPGHEPVGKPGRYVVYKTSFDGGGAGHGPHDIYPNGHHVFAELLEDAHVKISFYQSGCFSNMIENIRPVGSAARQWLFKDQKPEDTPTTKCDANRMEQMRKALGELQAAALAWWEGHRPATYDLSMHLKKRTVNCSTAGDTRLAKAVASAVDIGAL